MEGSASLQSPPTPTKPGGGEHVEMAPASDPKPSPSASGKTVTTLMPSSARPLQSSSTPLHTSIAPGFTPASASLQSPPWATKPGGAWQSSTVTESLPKPSPSRSSKKVSVTGPVQLIVKEPAVEAASFWATRTL